MNKEEPTTILGIRSSALLEIALFLIGMLVLDFVLFDAPHTRFFATCLHPFWIIVLLVSAQYGTKEGLVAAIASSAVLLIGNMPEQTINQDMYDYLFLVAKTPLSWLVAAVILGELRQKHIRERAELQQSLADSQEREDRITHSYQFVKDLKEKLELRIAGQLRSSVAAYQAARAMESLNPAQLLTGIEELVTAVLNPESFSIYLLDANGLSVTLTHGWREGDQFTRQFPTRSDFYRATIGSRQILNAANSEHDAILAGQGVLAGALHDKATGEVLGVLKIEKLGFTDLNLSSIETFAAICEWAGMSLVNARKYQTAKENSAVNPDHNLHTPGYFQKYTQYITALGKRVGFDVTMIVVKLANAKNLSADMRTQVARTLADAVDNVLRGVDLAFDYNGNAEEYSIVLPATDRKGADIVLEKIRRELASRLPAAARAADFTFAVQTLNQKA